MSFLFNIFAGLMGVVVSTFAYAETESLPALDAKFETIQCANPCKKTVKRDWWLMRAQSQVELRDVEKKTGQLTPRGEIWKRSPDGKMSYLFLMHHDKRAIEYLFDDLKVLGIRSDESQWQITSQLVSDTELVEFKKIIKKSITYQGYSTESYVGAINGAKVKLTWLPQLKIPVKLEYVYAKSKVTIQLQQLNMAGDTLATKNVSPKTTEELLNSYQQVYYTDIGDMEQSDDAKEWLAKAQGAPGLHSHHH
jgi:hypothetical protein